MILYVALFSLFVTLSGAQHGSGDTLSDSCEFYARRLGQPLDGWRRLYEGPNCVREPVNLRCAGQQYYDPESRIAKCCHTSGNIAWRDEEAMLGYCCAEEHEWTGDISTGDGGCCPIGLKMIDGECKHIASSPAQEESGHDCGCHSKSTSPPLDDEPVHIPTVKTPLSIHFGHCYNIFIGEQQIGSTRENTLYRLGGLFQNIPFRICQSTGDCTIGSSVKYHERFYLQDQIGMYSDPEGQMGWVTADKRALKMRFTLNAYEAEGYQGAMTCEKPGCTLILSGVPQEFHFNEVECETDLTPFPILQEGGQSHFHDIPVQPEHTAKPSCH